MNTSRLMLLGLIEVVVAIVILQVLIGAAVGMQYAGGPIFLHRLAPPSVVTGLLVLLAYVSGVGAGRKRAGSEWSQTRVVRYAIAWGAVAALLLAAAFAAGSSVKVGSYIGVIAVLSVPLAYVSGVIACGKRAAER